MNSQTAKRWIIRITLAWVLLGFALAGATVAGWMTKTQFQWVFPIGFVIYAVVTTVLSKFMLDP